MASAAKKAALSDAQDLSEILLDAEAKCGEMLAGIDKSKSYKVLPSKGGRKPMLPTDITYKQSHQAQTVPPQGYRHHGDEKRYG